MRQGEFAVLTRNSSIDLVLGDGMVFWESDKQFMLLNTTYTYKFCLLYKSGNHRSSKQKDSPYAVDGRYQNCNWALRN